MPPWKNEGWAKSGKLRKKRNNMDNNIFASMFPAEKKETAPRNRFSGIVYSSKLARQRTAQNVQFLNDLNTKIANNNLKQEQYGNNR